MLNDIPSENIYHIIPDTEIEHLVSFIKANEDETQIYKYIFSKTEELVKCSNCKRILIDPENNNKYDFYKLEY